MPKRHGCIFCGSKPLTLEHVFPQWLGHALEPLKPTAGAADRVVVLRNERGKDSVRLGDYWFTKDPGFTSKCVCAPCNNNWMSEIEGAAQPVLTKMIRGSAVALDLAAQAAVADWLALRSIIEQHSRPDPPPAAWVSAFCQERRPPTQWHIRIGRYEGNDWLARFVGTSIETTGHHGLSPFALKTDGFLFTVVVGHFMGQVVGLEHPGAIPANPRYFREVWPHPLLRVTQPPRSSNLFVEDWPPEHRFNDQLLDRCVKDTLEPR